MKGFLAPPGAAPVLWGILKKEIGHSKEVHYLCVDTKGQQKAQLR